MIDMPDWGALYWNESKVGRSQYRGREDRAVFRLLHYGTSLHGSCQYIHLHIVLRSLSPGGGDICPQDVSAVLSLRIRTVSPNMKL